MKSRARSRRNVADRGSPVSHTDPGEAYALGAGTEPGANNMIPAEKPSPGWWLYWWRCASNPGKSCLLQLSDEPVSSGTNP